MFARSFRLLAAHFPPRSVERSEILPIGSVGRRVFVYNAKHEDGCSRSTMLCILGKNGYPVAHFSEEEFKDLMNRLPTIESAMHMFEDAPVVKKKPKFPPKKKK
eukprot:GEMP01066810.1.p1 GENE.GEMP01066810.1~~GEMP01066810.1.p1  ORF type:complete len:104 (+),score=19.57 GEMP01066810.1:59-370(+)